MGYGAKGRFRFQGKGKGKGYGSYGGYHAKHTAQLRMNLVLCRVWATSASELLKQLFAVPSKQL